MNNAKKQTKSGEKISHGKIVIAQQLNMIKLNL